MRSNVEENEEHCSVKLHDCHSYPHIISFLPNFKHSKQSDPYIYVCTAPPAFTLIIPVFLSTEDIDIFLLTLTIIPSYLPVQHYSDSVVHILGVFFEVEIQSSNNMVHGIRRFASSYVKLLFVMTMYYLTR